MNVRKFSRVECHSYEFKRGADQRASAMAFSAVGSNTVLVLGLKSTAESSWHGQHGSICFFLDGSSY